MNLSLENRTGVESVSERIVAKEREPQADPIRVDVGPDVDERFRKVQAVMHDREQTMAQVRIQLVGADNDIIAAEAVLNRITDDVSATEQEMQALQREWFGLGALKNIFALREKGNALLAIKEKKSAAAAALTKAQNYRVGMQRHFENLQRRHKEDLALLVALHPDAQPAMLAAK